MPMSAHKPGPFHISEGPSADGEMEGPLSQSKRNNEAGGGEQASDEVKVLLLPSGNISLTSTKTCSKHQSMATAAFQLGSNDNTLQNQARLGDYYHVNNTRTD